MPHFIHIDLDFDRIAIALARPQTRRHVFGVLAAAVTATATAAAIGTNRADAEGRATQTCPPCGPNQTCIGGVCGIVVVDGCEAFGCPDDLQCIDSVCREPIDPAVDPTPTPTPAPTPDPDGPSIRPVGPHRKRRRRRNRIA